MAEKAESKGQSVANALYTKATAILRGKHESEFEAILDGLYAEQGLTRKRRLSAQERAERKALEKRAKAAEQLKALLAEFPDLASDVSGVIEPSGLDEFLGAPEAATA